MDTSTLVLALLDGTTLVLGGVLTALAYRAYNRTGRRPLRSLAAGFGLLTGGVLAGGILQVVGVELAHSLAVERGFAVAGLAVVVHSLVLRTATGTSTS